MMTPEDVEAEYLAHQYAEHGIPDEIEDENFDANVAAFEALMTGRPPLSDGDDAFEEVINDQRN